MAFVLRVLYKGIHSTVRVVVVVFRIHSFDGRDFDPLKGLIDWTIFINHLISNITNVKSFLGGFSDSKE